ncbi:uncharacterized protein LOC116180692 [Photinus pyralis]|uniref:uncharacterized protein LOC116180692 n=1 Tax=Photinus pyralis TaxID=7054 RepID=UPI00126780FE|nr:uncharacterized protein LOC116180692 [Photinus pyralis]
MAAKLKQFQAFRNISLTTLNTIHALSQQARGTWFQQVESCKETFDLNQVEIVSLLADKPDNLQQEIDVGVDFLAKYVEIKTVYLELFPISRVPNSSNPLRQSVDEEQKHFVDRLQKIALPKFDGNIRNWPHFRDLFVKLVDEKPYADVEKFHLLAGSLSGEPLNLVKSIPISDDLKLNYKIAFQALLDRYNNNRLLATLYWNEIQNIPVIPVESASSLRKLLNTVRENCEALKLLNLADTWDFVLFNVIIHKLDSATRKEIEIRLDKKKIPTFSGIEPLLSEHCLSLEALQAPLLLNVTESNSKNPRSFESVGKPQKLSLSSSGTFTKSPSKTSLVATSSSQSRSKPPLKCLLCSRNHSLISCPAFNEKQPQDRYEIAKRNRICLNCLASGHVVASCLSSRNCRTCDARHHTLLHFSNRPSSPVVSPSTSESNGSNQLTSCTSRCSATFMASNSDRPPVLLGTIVLEIRDRFGSYHIVRALLDPGSQASYLGSSLANKLRLSKLTNAVPICGLGQVATKSSSIVTGEIRPSDRTDPTFKVDFFVLDKICGNLPNDNVSSDIPMPDRVRLADYEWHRSRSVQMLLGADIYPQIASPGLDRRCRNLEHPFLLGTIFGHVVLGSVNGAVTSLFSSLSSPSSVHSPLSSLDKVVEQFWNVEEVPPAPAAITPEDDRAESIFRNSLYREPSGRFGVALPFKVSKPAFENSLEVVNRRFRSLENRFVGQPLLKLDSSHLTPLVSQFVEQLVNRFALGCFELRKWASNRVEVLDSIPLDHRQPQALSFDSESSDTAKILGLQWRSASDSFAFVVNPRDVSCTKRTLLSELARIYDPLGFLAPISFVAKCLIQQIWLLGLGWDAEPPSCIVSQWNQFKVELPQLSSLRIPRELTPGGDFGSDSYLCTLHGFCDASERGYAAVVYLSFSFSDRKSCTCLVIAKSKVAPLKQLSIPRLELCAAALLAKLVKFVLDTFRDIVVIDKIFAWTDSTIVLSWIRSLPRQWKVFVSNRIAYIHERIPPGCWRHVPSQKNSADSASRGLLPSQLLSHPLWWSGPDFLTLSPNFWPPEPININMADCNRCFRVNPTTYCPPSAHLPSLRVSHLKAFSVVGCDFAGPFTITAARFRGAKTLKSYLCIFVCFATKAVHLEVVSSLSTDAFIGSVRRFIARRGRCVQIFSDCGTNFVGANREFNRLMKKSVESQAIAWSFNPPSAPHFGGLWESGVKSVKRHLVRVVGNQILTLEEFNTVVIEIEAILNSRPLCPISTDPNDLASLTPGHFLTLEPLSSPPDPDLSHLKSSRLARWQMVQHMQQSFWARWKAEYLHTLYQKSHWATDKNLVPADIGTLVLIKDETTPPLKCRLGRIDNLFPGSDGVVTVASVRTIRGVLKRPLVKLCALPLQ